MHKQSVERGRGSEELGGPGRSGGCLLPGQQQAWGLPEHQTCGLRNQNHALSPRSELFLIVASLLGASPPLLQILSIQNVGHGDHSWSFPIAYSKGARRVDLTGSHPKRKNCVTVWFQVLTRLTPVVLHNTHKRHIITLYTGS